MRFVVYRIDTFIKTCLLIFIFLFSSSIIGGESVESSDISHYCQESHCVVSNADIAEDKEFFGLALYYNQVSAYMVDASGANRLEEQSEIILKEKQWFVLTGRFKVLLIKSPGLAIKFTDTNILLQNKQQVWRSDSFIKIVTKPELTAIASELDQIRYAHLFGPLAWLSKQVEFILLGLQANFVSNWGMVVIVFSVLLKLLLLPVSVMTVQYQRRVSQIQTKLAPKLAEIKAHFDGEEAHNRLMAAHAELGVSPFYTLKPILGSFVQIPVLIAVFNALGEMPQLDGDSFLWMANLAYPDVVGYLPFSIPMLGDKISLMPFGMTVVALIATLLFQNRHLPEIELKRQKRNLYLMAAVFFVLFYPFPAAMVLYWTLANVLQIIQQKVVKI